MNYHPLNWITAWGLLVPLNVAVPNGEPAAGPLEELKSYLAQPADKRLPLDQQAFAKLPLSKADAEAARNMLWADHVERIRRTRTEEMNARELREGALAMKFAYTTFGEKPKKGRSLFISMHGGGGAPKEVNDQQWENQKLLYQPAEGIYLSPRAPTNTWNLWHEPHIDRFFGRLIENLVVIEEVDPDRVYLMGYSAGGDGVYQLAPRLADRLAAASMMAGHPNDASPLGLRNIAFSIQVGANDASYNRNKIAGEWGEKLAALQKADPDGYVHFIKLYEGKGHWMDRQDAIAVPWMAKVSRSPFPTRVVWHQSGTTQDRFYWLAVDVDRRKAGNDVVATYSKDKNSITIESSTVDRLFVRMNDTMLNLDQPVTVNAGGQRLPQRQVHRTISVLAKTLGERGDPTAVFSAELEVAVPLPK